MDVRCEKCTTVYEFDDSKVGEQGVTVKCTQCGNLFKVKRREQTAELALGSATARSPAYVPPAAQMPAQPSTRRTTTPGIAVLGRRTPPTPVPPVMAPAAQPPPATRSPPDEPAGWMIRMAGSGEVFRFRELTTLQQWIVERKVSRDDEISRSGDQWKRLGGIAELSSFFHVVEQAAAVARADGPRAAAAAANAAYQRRQDSDDPALVTTAPMTREPSGPIAMGNPLDTDDPAFARTNPTPKLTPAAGLPVADDTLVDDDFERPARRRGGLWAGLLALLVLLGAGGYLAAFKRDAVRGLFAHPDARAEEACRQGREYFLLDSDDAFKNALTAFERGHATDGNSALPLAGLAEVETTWAQDLRDDARALDTGSMSGRSVAAAAAANTLRRQAQAHLDAAKKWSSEALNADSEAPEVNRAMADYLRVDGAPAAEVTRYLTRAAAKRADDPESAYVAGALAFRDGKLDEARAKMTEANQRNQNETQHALLRASYLLARIDLQVGDKAGAKQALETVLAANAQHDRARSLLATIEPDAEAATGAGAVRPAGVGAAATAPGGATATAAPAVPASGAAAKADGANPDATDEGKSGDYHKLVSQGDRLSENGHAREARKLYERALAQRPNGLEAIMGLGYCDLDGEKFSSAVDHFKRALSLQPSYGDAILGLAEAYKLRGDRHEALSWYKQYLVAQPDGPKASMAKNNIRDLEPRTLPASEVKPDQPKPSPPESTRAGDDTKPTDPPKPDDKPVQLPRPPTNDEPPP